MIFDRRVLQIVLDGDGHVAGIEVKPRQIPAAAQTVISGALADGAWRHLKNISLIGHQLRATDCFLMRGQCASLLQSCKLIAFR